MDIIKNRADLRVLLVDDNSSDRILERSLLTAAGIKKVDLAENGSQAYSKLCNVPYDLVITDWKMPVLDGADLLRHLRKEKRFRDIPTILLSAVSEEELILGALKDGVSIYMVKPMTKEILEEKLKQLFSASKKLE